MPVADWITWVAPSVVGVFYLATSIAYLCKGEAAWALIWFAYALGNVGLVLAGNKH